MNKSIIKRLVKEKILTRTSSVNPRLIAQQTKWAPKPFMYVQSWLSIVSCVWGKLAPGETVLGKTPLPLSDRPH